jgi:hypothetical protein
MVVTQRDLLSVLSTEHNVPYCGILAGFGNALPVHVSTSQEVDRPKELVELAGAHFMSTGSLPVHKERKTVKAHFFPTYTANPYRASKGTSTHFQPRIESEIACPSLLRIKLFCMQFARITNRTVFSLQRIGSYKMLNFEASVRMHTTLFPPCANHEHSWIGTPHTLYVLPQSLSTILWCNDW